MPAMTVPSPWEGLRRDPWGGYGTESAPPIYPSTDPVALSALVLGLVPVVPLLPVVLGVRGRRRTARTGRPGHGLATAGLVLGLVWLLVIAGTVAVVASSPHRASGTAGASAGSDGSAAQVTSGNDVRLEDLQAGDCLTDTGDADSVTLPVSPCATQHKGEVYEVSDLPGSKFPGEEGVARLASSRCASRLAHYVGTATYDDAPYDFDYFYPGAEGWADGDRQIICVLEDLDGASLTGSAKGSEAASL